MAIRDELLKRIKNQKISGVTLAHFNSAIGSMTNQEKLALVVLILQNPEEGGRRLRQVIISYIESLSASEVDALLAGSNISVTQLNQIFGA